MKLLLAASLLACQDPFEGRLLDTVPAGLQLDRIAFSPDGRRVAYVARENGKSFVVADRRRGEPFDAILAWSNIFLRPGGREIVYAAVENGKAFIVVNDKRAAETFDAI